MKHYHKAPNHVILIMFISIFFQRTSAHSQTFVYDASGRVVQAIYSDSTVLKYKYDPAGNLKKAKIIPVVTASISAAEIEGDVVKFNLHRVGDLTRALIVGLSAEGDAVNGRDYSSLPASVTFPEHESSMTFSVDLRPDRPSGAAKNLIVSLADSDDYGFDKHSSATVTIPEKK